MKKCYDKNCRHIFLADEMDKRNLFNDIYQVLSI